jgi:hypothetical protein
VNFLRITKNIDLMKKEKGKNEMCSWLPRNERVIGKKKKKDVERNTEETRETMSMMVNQRNKNKERIEMTVKEGTKFN